MVSSSHPLSVMRVFDIASHQFYGFFRTQKILKSEELLPSFTFKQKYRKKRKKKSTYFFHKLSGQSKVVKSYFRLAYPHVCTFPVWENIVSMVFFFTPTFLDGKTLHPIFLPWENYSRVFIIQYAFSHESLRYGLSVLWIF